MELWWEAGSCSPSKGKPQEGSQWREWEQGDCEGPWVVLVVDDRWHVGGFRMCLEVELTGRGCEGKSQGQLLAFERPEQLGKFRVAVMKTGGDVVGGLGAGPSATARIEAFFMV